MGFLKGHLGQFNAKIHKVTTKPFPTGAFTALLAEEMLLLQVHF